jgi:hypothetical protein
MDLVKVDRLDAEASKARFSLAQDRVLMSDLTRLDELIKRIDIAITTQPADGSVAATELADETRAQLDQTITPSRSGPDLRVTN